MNMPAEQVMAEQDALEEFEKVMRGEYEAPMSSSPLDGIYRIEIPELPVSPEERKRAVDRLFQILNNE